MKDQIKKIRGFVEILHYDKNMQLLEKIDVENLVVQTGLNWIAARLNDPVPSVMNYIAVGTDNTAPALNQTTLVAELFRAPVTTSGGSVSNNTLVFNQTLIQGQADGALTEAGIFSASSGGTMLSRVTYPVINKGPSDTIAINWTITIG